MSLSKHGHFSTKHRTLFLDRLCGSGEIFFNGNLCAMSCCNLELLLIHAISNYLCLRLLCTNETYDYCIVYNDEVGCRYLTVRSRNL